MGKRFITDIWSFTISIVVILTSVFVFPQLNVNCLEDSDQSSFGIANEYNKYIKSHEGYTYDVQALSVNSNNLVSVSNTFTDDGFVIVKDGTSAEWSFNIEKSGFYNVNIKYLPLNDESTPIEQTLLIDGVTPLNELSYISFDRVFSQPDISETDASGNDLLTQSKQENKWMQSTVSDPLGYVQSPLAFAFCAGNHKISLSGIRGSLAVDTISLVPCEKLENYEKPRNTKGLTNNSEYVIEAENISTKTAITIEPQTDRSSYSTTPQSAKALKLNSIGGDSWNTVGQCLSWDIEIKKDGYYKIGARYKQSFVDGCFVSRRLIIDGKVPFAEADNMKFNYDGNWKEEFFGNSNEDFLFYLNKGKHTITLEVVLGDISEMLGTISESLNSLNEIYRNLVMFTGVNPDPYRSYNFEEKLPDVMVKINNQYKLLSDALSDIEKITGSNSEYTVILNKLTRQLKLMFTEPEDNIPVLLTQFKSNIGSLGTWLLEACKQPLMLDKLYVSGADSQIPHPGDSGIKNILFGIRCFVTSFMQDYNEMGMIDDTKYAETIDVWVPTGRDQAQIIRQLIQQNFSKKYSIKVNLKLVSGANLLPSILGGSSPDVALSNASAGVMDYAIRNAIYPVSEFSDFNEVSSRFVPGAMTPYKYHGVTYALPEEFVFPMFFYRKDIFNNLGISVPQTWDEFIDLIPVLQSENMDIGLDISSLYILLRQKGGSLYVNEGEATALDTDVAKAAFKEYTEFFTLHRLPMSFDFANRFRTGEMPCGIVNYTIYNQLVVFAPEISGLWEMIPVPGIKCSDGNIEHMSVSSTGTASFILSSSNKKAQAWEFLKWWTSTETQSSYGLKMESVLGAAAKQPTANIEALTRMGWTSSEYKNIINQLEDVSGIPQVPGSYYTTRVLGFAVNKTYNSMADPIETLEGYYDELNDELTRKRMEFAIAND